jgi:hypothetical protein
METSEVPFAELLHFGGFDYASQKHYVIVLNRTGSKLLSLEFDNTAEGWRKFLDAIKTFPKIAFTIETSCGADVERLLDAGLTVYPINPKSAQRYRDRNILWTIWQKNVAYDEATHTRNQVKHGSWVVRHLPKSEAPAAN